MKRSLSKWLSIAAILNGGTAMAQNYLKTDLALSFRGGKELVQTFDLDVNRTEEVKEKEGGIYFLYTDKGFYISPTVSVNIGQAATASNNNIISQLSLGRLLKFKKRVFGQTSFLRIAAEFNPTYNTDKDFVEKIYYGQLKGTFNLYWDKFSGTAADPLLMREISVALNPVLNLGKHESALYHATETYSALGFNTAFIVRWNKLDDKGKAFEDWVIKLTANGYRLFSEIDALYAKDYYGQAAVSIDKAINNKIAVSVSYKYGNESAKYETISALGFGFKYKF